MADIKPAVDRFAREGVITRDEYDALMEEIQKDGEVDAGEQEQTVRIFKLVQDGKLKIVDESREELEKAPKPKPQQVAAPAAPAAPVAPAAPAKPKVETPPAAVEQSANAASTAGQDPFSVRAPANPNATFEELKPPVVEEAEEASPPIEAKEPQAVIPKEPQTAEPVVAPMPSSGKYSLDAFISRAQESTKSGESFDLKSDRVLEIQLAGSVWIKAGSMVAYRGDIKFSREGIFEHGLKKTLSKKVTGEGTNLSKAMGSGELFIADSGKKVSIIELTGNSITVNGNDLLAFESSVEWEIKSTKSMAAMIAGGMFNVHLKGSGKVAFTTHGDPLVIRVTTGESIVTDPQATVAWSGTLTPTLKADVGFQTLIGRASGETTQMHFQGEGFVVVQPYEEEAKKNSK